VRHAALLHRRHQLVEVEFARAERIVRARIVLVERPVRIDQVKISLNPAMVRTIASSFLMKLGEN